MNSEFHAHPRTAVFRVIAVRFWPVLLIGALFGATCGWAVGAAVQENRTATATVLLNPLEGNAFYPSARGEQLVNLATEAQVLSSNGVANSVIDRTGAEVSPQEMLDGVSASIPANTQIVEISYTYPKAEIAELRAQTFAEAFLDFRRQRAVSYVDNQVESVQKEIDSLSEELRQLTAELNIANVGLADKSVIVAQIESKSSQVAQLGAQNSALATTSLEPGQVITPAAVQEASPFGIQKILVVAGLLCGLAAALAVFFFVSRGRGRIRSAAEVQAYNVDMVAAVPVLPGTAGPSFVNPPTLGSVTSSYLRFRAQFISLLREHRRESLLITSSSPTTPYPESVVPLALSLAAAEIRTIVIDTTGEIELPGAEADNQPGLSELLQDNTPVEQALVRINSHLHAIGIGHNQEGFSELFLDSHFPELLANLGSRADVVLIAGRSILTTATQSVAGSVQYVLVEVELGRTRHEDLRKAVDTCAGLDVKLLGALVLTRPRRESSLSNAGTSGRSESSEPEETHRLGSPAYGA